MQGFVGSRGNEGRHVPELFGLGQLNMIGCRGIIALVSAIADLSTRVVEEAVGMLDTLQRLCDRLRATVIVIGKSVGAGISKCAEFGL